MKKFVLMTSLLFSSLWADYNLGVPISSSQTVETTTTTTTTTRVSPDNIARAFREDDQRYDNRYSNFDYDNEGYYNDDGYYYGYYDTTGYFFNNIFFLYTLNFTYNDRRYRRGYFRPHRHHHRAYTHHSINNWNRTHRYREPNQIVYGHYYERNSRPITRYRDNARMTTPHQSNDSSHQGYRSTQQRFDTQQRMPRNQFNQQQRSNEHRSNHNSRFNSNRDTARMTTPRSSNNSSFQNNRNSSTSSQQRSHSSRNNGNSSSSRQPSEHKGSGHMQLGR